MTRLEKNASLKFAVPLWDLTTYSRSGSADNYPIDLAVRAFRRHGGGK